MESNHGRFAGAVLGTDGRSTPPIIGIALDGTRSALIRDTDGGRLDGDRVYDRAVGPTQFIPSTWKTYASDGDGDGTSDPLDIDDAAAATAKYLCAAGGDLSSVAGQTRAVFAYNHSASYVATVLTLAATYAGTPPPVITTPSPEELPAMPPANPAPPPAISESLPTAAGPGGGRADTRIGSVAHARSHGARLRPPPPSTPATRHAGATPTARPDPPADNNTHADHPHPCPRRHRTDVPTPTRQPRRRRTPLEPDPQRDPGGHLQRRIVAARRAPGDLVGAR